MTMQLLRSIVANLTTLLLALMLSLIVWAVAVRSNDPIDTRNLEISIETVNRPADASIVGGLPDSAAVTLRGPISFLDEARPSDIRGIIDLSQAPFGESEQPVRVQFEDAELQDQVEVVGIFPSSVQVRLDQIITRNIPIVADVRGDVARGHRVSEASVEPSEVQVSGSAQRVNQLVEGRITAFLDNAREDIIESRRPIYYDLQGNVVSVAGLDVQPTEVELLLTIDELAGFAEKPISVDWVGEPAPGYRLLNISVEPTSVQVTGPPTRLEGLRVRTEEIDISGLTESVSLRASLNLPDDISQVEVQPIVVTVEIEPILTSDVVQRQIEVRGLGEELEATLDPQEVRVFLFGPLPVLDSLAADEVRVTVDLLGLEVGEHVVEPIVSVAANSVEVRSVQPEVVTVVVSETIPVEENGETSLRPLEPTVNQDGGPGNAFAAFTCGPTGGACRPEAIAFPRFGASLHSVIVI
ncbi:MAG: CdaR family protein [Candidatus Promineifilaceae bacterium]|nr:CdaR family protein [Candidatus Promineifilaceae bacterium]